SCETSAQGDRLLFPEQGANCAMTFTAECGDADAAFKAAAYTRREQFRTGRHYGLTMEPRGVMAEWEAATGRLTVSGAAKVPFFNRRILAILMGLPEDAIAMVENDVGGGFGARGEFYPEDFLIPFAARHVGRPVKWIEDRRENLMAMNHARQADVEVEIACTRDGIILALRGHAHVDMGAYMRTNGAVAARNIAQFMTGPYRIPNIRLQSSLWMTNKTPGRPLPGTRPLRNRFLPRTPAGHAREGPRHRSRRTSSPQSHPGVRHAISIADDQAVRVLRRDRQRRLSCHARPLPRGIRLGR